jgi:D-alanyl-D-alanine carboxypeptidase/D-alanyl-D-alanine-endopeptidase (penicillin-binding protein 4)
MAERSYMPIYGNIVRVSGKAGHINIIPKVSDKIFYDTFSLKDGYVREVHRNSGDNDLNIIAHGTKPASLEITLFTDNGNIIKKLLSDTLKLDVDAFGRGKTKLFRDGSIKTQPTDSMLKLMMHRSDNFFAEQSLMMVSNELLGYMNDNRIIDTLLKTDFKNLPQKPRWADGSGLSRYNLFTPQDFVSILNKMKNEFGMDRLKVIMATGGEGTISSYYKADSGYIYGKTGTLSGVVAFSGFLYTKKGKLLIFSTLVNNHQASATDVRRAIEKFLQKTRNTF